MYKKTTLKNGLTLITAPLASTEAVTVLVLVPVGSRYEARNTNGISHFIEHLMFKGTKRRPTSIDLTKELDSVGADYNAFTSKDYTGYYVKAAAAEAERAFDIISDMLFNSTFDPREIDKERGVIVEEINMYEDNPLMHLPTLYESTAFGDHPLGWSIAGPREVITSVSRETILEYRDRHYSPAHMVLSVAGNITEKAALKFAEKYFGGTRGSKTVQKPKAAPVVQRESRVQVKVQKTEQVQLGMGFPSYPLGDKRLYPLMLLSVVLGGNMSSRLFSVVREQHGLAYYIKTDVSPYSDTGTFMVQAGLDKSRINDAISLIASELKKTAAKGVTENELSMAKHFIRGRLVLSLEDSESVADWYGKQQLMLKKIMEPEDRLKRLFAVSAEDVQKAAAEIINTKRLSLALIGPIENQKKIETLVRSL